MGIGTAIKAARERAGKSQNWLGERVGRGQTGVSSWERGRTEPTREDVARVAEALGIPVAELEGAARETRKVPLVGYVGAGDAAHFYAVDQGELDSIEAPDTSPPPISAREIRGRSMGMFYEGWIVFTGERQPGVPDPYVGSVCEVGLPDGRILIKQVRRAKLPGLFHLFSETEEPMLDEEVEWSAKVLDMRQR